MWIFFISIFTDLGSEHWDWYFSHLLYLKLMSWLDEVDINAPTPWCCPIYGYLDIFLLTAPLCGFNMYPCRFYLVQIVINYIIDSRGRVLDINWVISWWQCIHDYDDNVVWKSLIKYHIHTIQPRCLLSLRLVLKWQQRHFNVSKSFRGGEMPLLFLIHNGTLQTHHGEPSFPSCRWAPRQRHHLILDSWLSPHACPFN